jgi:predicted ATP-grasp superfamily ATP-dependent carboligase
VDVAKLQKQVDDLAKQIRELNGAIQEGNWQVELNL